MTKFEDTNHYSEIVLRGTYLSMAADVEWILLTIIAQIFRGHETDLDNMYGKPLYKLTLFDKIGCVQLGFIRYHTKFFIDHKEDFKELQLLRSMRNKFGHGKIEWIAENNNEDLFISETRITGIEKNKYKISELMKELRGYNDSVMKFLDTLKSIMPI